jgi:hypothetical protein
LILLVQIGLVLLVAAFVLGPLLELRGVRAWTEPIQDAKLRSITERKARLYGALLELDFDRDSGKISAEDHARMRDETMHDVLAVLAEEERLGIRPSQRRPAVIRGGDEVERMIEEYKRTRSARAEAGGS